MAHCSFGSILEPQETHEAGTRTMAAATAAVATDPKRLKLESSRKQAHAVLDEVLDRAESLLAHAVVGVELVIHGGVPNLVREKWDRTMKVAAGT